MSPSRSSADWPPPSSEACCALSWSCVSSTAASGASAVSLVGGTPSLTALSFKALARTACRPGRVRHSATAGHPLPAARRALLLLARLALAARLLLRLVPRSGARLFLHRDRPVTATVRGGTRAASG